MEDQLKRNQELVEKIEKITGVKSYSFTLTEDDLFGLEDLRNFLKLSEEIRNSKPSDDLMYGSKL